MSAVKRGDLLDRYGFEKRWLRYDQVVRIIDAKHIRGVAYIAWVHAHDGRYGLNSNPVRWITERNFNRFYREHTEVTT